MEAIGRHLRDAGSRVVSHSSVLSPSRHPAPRPMVLLCEQDLNCLGGRDVMHRLLRDYLSAISKGLCEAGGAKLLMLDGSCSGFLDTQWAQVVDGCSDPGGWSRAVGLLPASAPGDARQLVNSVGPGALPGMLQALGVRTGPSAPQQQPQPPPKFSVVVDNLSVLLLHHPATQVLAFMEQLRAAPQVSCVVAVVHEDVAGSAAAAALQRLASCVVRLEPLTGLQRDVLPRLPAGPTSVTPHGFMSCSFTSRKAGRLRSEGAFYMLTHGQGLVFLDTPQQLAQLITPEALVALSLRAKAAQGAPTGGQRDQAGGAAAPRGGAVELGGSDGSRAAPGRAVVAAAVGALPASGAVGGVSPPLLPPQQQQQQQQQAPMELAGSMRLTLTPQERQAREGVVLPYEHRGNAAAYQTNDWRTYLPVAAGGTSGAATHMPHSAAAALPQQEQQMPLGQIHYVRDSDEENGGLHDSDEDPDDDLDI